MRSKSTSYSSLVLSVIVWIFWVGLCSWQLGQIVADLENEDDDIYIGLEVILFNIVIGLMFNAALLLFAFTCEVKFVENNLTPLKVALWSISGFIVCDIMAYSCASQDCFDLFVFGHFVPAIILGVPSLFGALLRILRCSRRADKKPY